MKILIWDKKTPLSNIGGPSGYLYNIHEYLKDKSNSEVYFYSDIIAKEKEVKNIVKKNNWVNKTFFKIPLLKFVYTLFSIFFKPKRLSPTEIELINKFDYVHFHWLSEILKYHKSLGKTNARIILTTHTPEPLIDEILHNSKKSFILKFNVIRNIFIRREILAFKYADYIMFPSKYSSEVYTNVSHLYKKAFAGLSKKFFYVPTAISDISNTEKTYSKFVKDNLASLNICYIGRHIEIKGYDKLKDIAIEVWKEISNIHFYIGGKEGPLYGLNDFRWHELGWVNTSNLLNEIDVFILPNKETYYDLILLEVLKSGKPVILTRTGGNKQFIDMTPNTGLFYYEYNDIHSAIEQIKIVLKLKNEGSLDRIGHDNFVLFKKTSCQSIYMKKYIEGVKSLGYRK